MQKQIDPDDNFLVCSHTHGETDHHVVESQPTLKAAEKACKILQDHFDRYNRDEYRKTIYYVTGK